MGGIMHPMGGKVHYPNCLLIILFASVFVPILKFIFIIYPSNPQQNIG